MDPYKGLTEAEANAYVAQHLDREAHAAILSGSFTVADMVAWRKSIGLPKTRFIRLLGYERTVIWEVERGKRQPTVNYLKAFREVARRAERGLFTPDVPDPVTDYHAYSFVPKSDVVLNGLILKKCANPHCPNERLMTGRRRFCSDACRYHTHKLGLTDATYSNEPERTPRRPATGPITARCPHCGETFPAAGNFFRIHPTTRDGGRAYLTE